MTKENKQTYRLLFLIIFCISLGFCVVNPFLPLYLQNVGASGLYIALAYSGYALTKLVLTPLLGRWSDRRNRRVFIILGLTIYCGISVGYLFLPRGIAVWSLFLLLQGVGAALVRPLALASVADMAQEKHAGVAMGTFDVSFYLASGVGPVIGGFLNDTNGFAGIFLVLSVLCFIALFLSLFLVRGTPALTRSFDDRAGFRYLLHNRNLLGLCCFIFTRSFGIVLAAIFLPIYLSNKAHLNGSEIGLIMAFGTIIMAVLLRPFGKVCDHCDRRTLMQIGGASTAFLTLCLPLENGFWSVMLLSGGIGLFSAMTLPASSALLIEEGRRYGMGLTMGLFNSAMNLGFILAPLLGGFLMDHFTLAAVFEWAGLIGAGGIVAFSFLCSGRVSGNRGMNSAAASAGVSYPFQPFGGRALGMYPKGLRMPKEGS
jgi:MFS transporter, DHA1 family, multidrug resistance protein